MIDIENIERSSAWVNATQSHLELKEIILELVKELKAARFDLEVVKEMKGAYLQCACHPEGTDWKECGYMRASQRAFRAAARVATKEKIKHIDEMAEYMLPREIPEDRDFERIRKIVLDRHNKLEAVAKAASEVLPHLICYWVSDLGSPKHSAFCHKCELEKCLKELDDVGTVRL